MNHLSITVSCFIFMLMIFPMFAKDYKEHSRKGNYVAWDYGYNLLNSCEPNAIIFTNGDNDTFPLWYLQEVENIRTDVKVVNLSLLNFSSYIRQLDQHEPNLKMFEYNQDYLEAIDTDRVQEYAYQNWVVGRSETNGSEIINIETENGIIMGIEHKKFNVHGVQFHPESIKTTIGIKILKNFINYKK